MTDHPRVNAVFMPQTYTLISQQLPLSSTLKDTLFCIIQQLSPPLRIISHGMSYFCSPHCFATYLALIASYLRCFSTSTHFYSFTRRLWQRQNRRVVSTKSSWETILRSNCIRWQSRCMHFVLTSSAQRASVPLVRNRTARKVHFVDETGDPLDQVRSWKPT